MARSFRPVNRDMAMLLPLDMRDWLPGDDLAWFILDFVENLDVSGFGSPSGTVGRRGYDPAVLLSLWLYAYSRGVVSSRAIEQACRRDLGFMVICALDVPDHTVLSRFRTAHRGALSDAFAQGLDVCVREGLGSFGVVSLDGTKIQANASSGANRDLAALQQMADALIEASETQDASDERDSDTDDGSGPPAGGSGRAQRIRRALAAARDQVGPQGRDEQVERWQRRVAHHEAILQAKLEARDEYAARYEEHRRRHGVAPRNMPPPVDRASAYRREREKLQNARDKLRAAQERVSAGTRFKARGRSAKANITDPDARIMKTRSAGLAPAYNAQIVVDEKQLIVACALTQQATDVQQFGQMMTAAQDNIARACFLAGRHHEFGVLLADTGYLSAANLAHPGPPRLIAPHRRAAHATTRASASDTRMQEALSDPANQQIYRTRSTTVEPVNAHLDTHGLNRAATRSRPHVECELLLAAIAHNARKLYHHARTRQPANPPRLTPCPA